MERNSGRNNQNIVLILFDIFIRYLNMITEVMGPLQLKTNIESARGKPAWNLVGADSWRGDPASSGLYSCFLLLPDNGQHPLSAPSKARLSLLQAWFLTFYPGWVNTCVSCSFFPEQEFKSVLPF